jgi:WD40 repeat protein
VLASASTDTIILWDMPDGTVRRQFSSHLEHVWSIAWSPDGTLLASAGQDGSVVLWFNR